MREPVEIAHKVEHSKTNFNDEKKVMNTEKQVSKNKHEKKKKGAKIKHVHVGPEPMEPDKEYINPNCDDQMEIYGYKLKKRNYVLTWILFIFSLGFLRLLFYWIPRFMLYFTHVECSLAEAEQVLLRDQHKQWLVAKILTITRDGTSVRVLPSTEASFSIHRDKLTTSIGLPSQTSTQQPEVKLRVLRAEKNKSVPLNQYFAHYKNLKKCKSEEYHAVMLAVANDEHLIRYFLSKKVKYLWKSQASTFVKLRGLDSEIVLSYFHEAKGLLSEEVIQKRVSYGNNRIAIHVTPIITLLFKEILSPFYVFQVFSVILWFCDAYELYASCIIFISLLSIVTTVYQTRQIQRALRNTIHATEVVRVCRDNEYDLEAYKPLIEKVKKEEMRILFLYEFKLGHNSSQIATNINRAWEEGSTSDRRVRMWFQKFRSGNESVEDEESRGRPCTLDQMNV